MWGCALCVNSKLRLSSKGIFVEVPATLTHDKTYYLYVKAVDDEDIYGDSPWSDASDVVYNMIFDVVTDAESLQAGDQIVIAYYSKSTVKSAVAANANNSGYLLGNITSNVTQKTITKLSNAAVVFALGGEKGAWTLTDTATGLLLGATAVGTLAWDDGSTAWSISISSSNATISNNGGYGQLLYYSTMARFTTYSKTATNKYRPQIYRLRE